MTISIINQDPAPAAVNVSPFINPKLTLNSDDPLGPVALSAINIWASGIAVIAGGIPVPGTTVTDNGIGGFDVAIEIPREIPQEDDVIIRVAADDVLAASAIDTTYFFSVADARGPRLANISPPPGAITTSSPKTISFRIVDPGTSYDPETTRADFVASPADLEHNDPNLTGNQILFRELGIPYPPLAPVAPYLSFAADGITSAGDVFQTTGVYTFTDNDVGKHLRVNEREYRIIARNSGTEVQVDKPFGSAEVAVDWTLLNFSMEKKVGRLFEVNTGVDAGERRRIIAAHGPHMASYDGVQLNGTSESVTMFSGRGLDVVIDGVRVIHSGFPDSDAALAGWVAIVNLVGTEIEVSITSPVTWTPGERVSVHVRVGDDNPELVNVSDINYFFDVIDTRGPQIINITPAESSRGLDPTASPNSDLTFDVLCTQGVDATTLNVEVNGAAAVTAGVGVGDWSTSTITAIEDGYQVILKKAAVYTDGEIVFVDVNADDITGRPGERRVLRFHFGVTEADVAANTGLGGNDIVRVIAYDLGGTSFAEPEKLDHNGFAANGYLYTNGNRSPTQASWFTELGAFPISGHIVVTATNGWAIIKALGASPWMTCVPQTSPAWSMADNDSGVLTDADFGRDAVLAISGNTVIAIDFSADQAERYNSAGKTLSNGDITGRDTDLSGFATDIAFSLPLGPYSHVALVRDQKHLLGPQTVIAIASSGNLTVVADITEAFKTLLRGRDSGVIFAPLVTTKTFPGTWQRIRLGHLSDVSNLTALVISYNDSGQGQVEIWDWHKFSINQGNELFIDDSSTPAVAAAEIRDLEISHLVPSRLAVAALMVGELDLIDFDFTTPASSSVVVHTETDMGLNGVASAELSAVALEPGFRADFGHLYAAVAAAADGRVTRFRVHSPSAPARVATLDNGQPYTSLAAIGGARHDEINYVRMSMKIA